MCPKQVALFIYRRCGGVCIQWFSWTFVNRSVVYISFRIRTVHHGNHGNTQVHAQREDIEEPKTTCPCQNTATWRKSWKGIVLTSPKIRRLEHVGILNHMTVSLRKIYIKIHENQYQQILLLFKDQLPRLSWVLVSTGYAMATSWNHNIDSLWPREDLLRHRSGSSFAQVMAWGRQAASHYPKKSWLLNSCGSVALT